MKKILIGIDDSKFADYAAAYGFELAHKLKATVGLVHIVEPIAIPMANTTTDPVMILPGENDLDLMNIQDEYGKKLLAAAVKKYAGNLQVTVFEEYGSTAEGIISCSKDFKADMIVIGTHSRTGLDRFLMGSVAEYVVRHTEIPVLVVPMKHED